MDKLEFTMEMEQFSMAPSSKVKKTAEVAFSFLTVTNISEISKTAISTEKEFTW